MLVDEFVEITVTNRNYKYFMDRGYEMPDEYINSKGNISLKFGFKILVYYFDLSESSRTKVRVKCDYPGCTDIHETEYRYYTKYNHDGITYCSKHANPVFRSGEKHPSYNPNKEYDNIRKTPEYAIAKLSVHERDKYTCVSCGKKIYDPVFHHLYSVNTHKELACKIDNAVTLCKKCHKDFHDIYGYGNNIPAQFIDFIKRELDWLEDYDKTKVEKKLVYCAELDETSTKSYFSKKLDILLNGICATINPNTGKRSVKGYHFISIQEKEKMKPEEFEKWKKNSLIEHENYSEIPKNKRLIWHKESGEIKKAKDFLNTFGIEELRHIYDVCDRKQHSIRKQHFMWLEDYNEAIEDPKKMKEWEEWILDKSERLIWHKESGEIKKAKDFKIDRIGRIYEVCERKLRSIYGQHFMWLEDYNEAIEDPKKMREWEEWAFNKNERLIWHKETNQFYTAKELVGKFGIKSVKNVYSACDRKQKHAYNNHYLWAEDYKKMTQEQMKEWENWILSKTIRNTGGQNAVKVICITENTIFNSIVQAAKYYNTSNISSSCRYNNSRSKNDNLKSAGNYKGKKLIWMYEEKFIQEYGIEAYNNLIQIK